MNIFIKIFQKPEGTELLQYKLFRYVGIVFVVFILPALLLYFIKTDPVIGHDEYGDPTHVAAYVFFLLYWALLFFAYHFFLYKKYLDKLVEMIIFRRGLKNIRRTVEQYTDAEDEESFMYETDTDVWLERLGIKESKD